MRYPLVLLALVGCSGAPDEGPLRMRSASFEPRAMCADRCAIATGTTATLIVEHVPSDYVEDATVTAVAVDRPDVIAPTPALHGVTVRALAVGHARLTVLGTADTADGEVRGVGELEVVDATQRIVPRGTWSEADAVRELRAVLEGSDIEILLDRTDAAGEPVLGDNARPWTVDATEVVLVAVGETGLVQRLQAGGPEQATIEVGSTTRPIDIVPVSAVAGVRLHFLGAPEPSAGDGETFHMPYPGGGAIFELDLLDASGRYLEGDGGGAVAVTSPATRLGGTERGLRYMFEGLDQEITIVAGARTFRITLDYP